VLSLCGDVIGAIELAKSGGAGDEFDLRNLTACAKRLKNARPEFKDETQVTITANPGVDYKTVIGVMDSLRADGEEDPEPRETSCLVEQQNRGHPEEIRRLVLRLIQEQAMQAVDPHPAVTRDPTGHGIDVEVPEEGQNRLAPAPMPPDSLGPFEAGAEQDKDAGQRGCPGFVDEVPDEEIEEGHEPERDEERGQPLDTAGKLTRSEALELDKKTLDAITAKHPHVREVLKKFHEQRAQDTVEAILKKRG
jgi:hypothetical protein